MQTAGLGLCRNRHGNQFHSRIHIPKDLVLAFGRAEIRISLGTEARRYAIAAARIIQAAKITAFDELRAAMSERKVRAPGPEDQEHNRTRLLEAIRRRLEVRQLHDPQNEARLVQEADEEARVLAKQDAETARIVALEEEVRRTEYTLARRVHEVIGSTDPSYDAHKLTTDQRDLHSANESLRAELVNAEEGRRADQAAAESNANTARKMAHIAASRVANTAPLITPIAAPARLFSELVEEFMTITSVGKKGAQIASTSRSPITSFGWSAICPQARSPRRRCGSFWTLLSNCRATSRRRRSTRGSRQAS